MRFSFSGCAVLLVVAGVLACGCGCSEEASQGLPGPPGPQPVSAARLPKLGDPVPFLDDGRIDAAPPEGWLVPGRSSKWIARFQQEAGTPYPTIVITAEDDADCPDVSAENVNRFAARIASAESAAAVKPVAIDHFVGVAYRKRGLEKDSLHKILERLFLVTVVAGRKYTLELRTREGALAEAQPYLLAVARGIKFHQARADGPERSASRQPAETPQPDAPKETEAEPSKSANLDDLDVELEGLEDLLK